MHCSALSFASLVCFGFWLLLLSVSPAHGESMVPAIYVLGDSQADVGNNNHLTFSFLKANYPYNGIDYPGGKPTGRYSNGKIFVDFLAEKIGIPTPPPYLSLKASSEDTNAFLQGVNFASGGAGVLNSTNAVRDNAKHRDHLCVTFDKQIEYFSNVSAALAQQLGSSAAQTHLSKSLFVVVIGSNDFLEYFNLNSILRPNISPQQYVDSLLHAIRGQLQRLYGFGARKIVLLGTAPVGCTPAQRSQSSTSDCNAESNYWSGIFSEGVSSLLQEMKLELRDMNYSFVNGTHTILEFINNPAEYGFEEVKAACCGLGNLRAKFPCTPLSKCCENRTSHVFWDLYHPSESTCYLLTNTMFDGSNPHVFPINIRQLISL